MPKPRKKMHRLKGELFFNTRPMPIIALCDDLATIGPHDHDFYEIVVVAQGDGEHLSAQGQRRLQRGDAFVVSPGTWHSYSKPEGLVIHNCCFSKELLGHEATNFGKNAALSYLLHTGLGGGLENGILWIALTGSSLAACEGHLKAIHLLASKAEQLNSAESGMQRPQAIIKFDRAYDQVVLVGRLLLLLGELLSHLSEEHKASINMGRHMHQAVRGALSLLNKDPARKWSLPVLAEELHIDPSYLNRLFKAEVGLPPMAYMAQLRLERAANILRRSKLKIGEVGREVGWPDPSYFAERFKAHFGLSPREYRVRFSQISENHAPD